jgi:hypothetical protein
MFNVKMEAGRGRIMPTRQTNQRDDKGTEEKGGKGIKERKIYVRADDTKETVFPGRLNLCMR